MKNKTIALVIAASVATLTVSSCRKEKADVIPSASTMITGTWRIVSTAQDHNDNSRIDSNEITYNPHERATVFTFYYDGSGILESTFNDSLTYSQAITWNLQNDNKEIMIIANEPFTGKILTLDNDDLVLLYENGAIDPLIKENFWIMFQKKR